MCCHQVLSEQGQLTRPAQLCSDLSAKPRTVRTTSPGRPPGSEGEESCSLYGGQQLSLIHHRELVCLGVAAQPQQQGPSQVEGDWTCLLV